jgi:hypothetical protein
VSLDGANFEAGKSETVISNIGTIVLSLPPYSSSTDAATATQVRLISAANTLSRLLVGPLADFVSPIASHSGAQIVRRRYHISRVTLLFLPIVVLTLTYLWMVVGVRSQVGLWALRSVTTSLNTITTLISSLALALELLMVQHSRFCKFY